MDDEPVYQAAAQQYAGHVQMLFAPAVPSHAERSAGGVAPPATTIVARAEQLAPASDRLTEAAAARLQATDPATRTEVSTQLLAKALVDLQVSAFLLQAAADEQAGLGAVETNRAERGAGAQPSGGVLDEPLRIVLGEDASTRDVRERGTRHFTDLQSAREELINTASDTLLLIRQRASKSGQAALSGLLGLGAGEVSKAAGLVGMNMAQALGHVEQVTRLYSLFRDFALKAYDSLLALLGPTVAQLASQQVLAWIDEVKSGTLFGTLLDLLYETAATEQAVRQMVEQSSADLERYAQAIDDVSALGDSYGKQVGLVDKLTKGLGFLGGVPSTLLPQGKLLLAAAYLVLGAYVVLAGGDFVDAQRLRLLDRAMGVRETVAHSLAGA